MDASRESVLAMPTGRKISYAEQGMLLNVLKDDPDPKVRQVVAGHGFMAGNMLGDPDPDVRAAAIATCLEDDIDLVDTITGTIYMPDIAGEPATLYGVMEYKASREQVSEALEAGYESLGMWARDCIPAPGALGAPDRMDFSSIIDTDDLEWYAASIAGGRIEPDCKDAMQKLEAVLPAVSQTMGIPVPNREIAATAPAMAR